MSAMLLGLLCVSSCLMVLVASQDPVTFGVGLSSNQIDVTEVRHAQLPTRPHPSHPRVTDQRGGPPPAPAPVAPSVPLNNCARLWWCAQLDVFNHTVSAGSTFGVMTHFWCTGGPALDAAVWRYYIDGEKVASIQFTSAMAAGVGFLDTQGPWGTQWMGKGAHSGGWYNNFRIPFRKSIRITGQLPEAAHSSPRPSSSSPRRQRFHGVESWQTARGVNASGSSQVFWMIVRGSENLPTSFHGFTLPSAARLVQSRLEGAVFAPLQYVPLMTVEAGKRGLLFCHTLSVSSASLNFIEGCYHAFTKSGQAFPGLIVGTGTEDYFDSAFAFDGGQFHSPESGLTHYSEAGGQFALSAYRMHDVDPVFFTDGFRLLWRNGDALDSRGFKCLYEQGGTTVGTPLNSTVTAYTWAYTW